MRIVKMGRESGSSRSPEKRAGPAGVGAGPAEVPLGERGDLLDPDPWDLDLWVLEVLVEGHGTFDARLVRRDGALEEVRQLLHVL